MQLREKISKIWSNPYAAPLTEPLKNIGSTTASFLSSYTEAVKDARNDRYLTEAEKKKSRYMRFFANLFSLKNPLTLLNVAGFVLSGSVGASFGGFTTYGALAGSSTLLQTAATAAAAITAGTIGGVVVAPLMLMTTVGVAGLAAGVVVGGVPGVIKGVAKAYKEYASPQNNLNSANSAAFAASAPAASTQTPAQEILSKFFNLPREQREALFEDIEKGLADTVKSKEKRILSQIVKLDENQRIALIEALQTQLGGSFDAVAMRRATEAGQLGADVSVKPLATKLRRKNSSAPDASARV